VDRLDPEQLEKTSRLTLQNYAARAASFWEGTRDHDVSQNVEALLEELRDRPSARILDFGCGPGRDLSVFAARGCEAIGLDGCEEFAEMARGYSGCEVWVQDFLALDLPRHHFDGIFANASLFHVPVQELGRVLGELNQALCPGGVLFSSNPRGENEEGWNHGRYGSFHSLERWQAYARAAGFSEIRHYYRPPGLPRENQHWLASLWRLAED